MIRLAILFLPAALLFSCQSEQATQSDTKESSSKKENVSGSADFEFPKMDSLANFPHTAFVITLDQDLGKDKNFIYAATIAYCWDAVKAKYNHKISIDPEFKLLSHLHQFEKHNRALRSNEYTINISSEGDKTTFNAQFQKTLPFSSPMQRMADKMNFVSDSVEQFGFNASGYHDFGYVQILFYDKAEYGLYLTPLDYEHGIYLYFNEKENHADFADAYSAMIKKTENFNTNEKIAGWKRSFQYRDEVRIPVVSFHLKSKIQELIGNFFIAENIPHEILDVWQRNAFVLNENGAKAESEGEITEETAAAEEEEEEPEEEKPYPKYFHFNKPFYIFLKRRDADYPYFAVYITNTELLLKK